MQHEVYFPSCFYKNAQEYAILSQKIAARKTSVQINYS